MVNKELVTGKRETLTDVKGGKPKMPYIDHLGIIVKNLDQTISMFDVMFDLKPAKIKEMPDVGLRIAQLDAENISIELIQYTGQGKSFGKEVMGTETGLNHFSVKVKDIKMTLDDLESKGFKVMEGFPREGSHGRVAFFEPETTGGVLVEVCEG